MSADMFEFDNSFVRDLEGLYEPWAAATASAPELLVLNEPLAASLGVDPDRLRDAAGLDVLVGNRVPAGAEPVAQAYAGHQFGGFSPRLGDGRALLLGEVIGGDGIRRDVHLKGSGRTPFARGGDGLASVGPMLREHLLCEAMHALGVPTTRGLAVVATGDPVRRETLLPGAVFVRVASSHLRVGTFQYAAGLDDPDLLVRLVRHAIARHHPDADGLLSDRPTPSTGTDPSDTHGVALALLEHVMDVQASTIARWMNLGFVHGVMNTDNSTISGETIDYGPCAFLDAYDPTSVFSSIDHGGRYAYANQPSIGQWNLARLAEPLLPLIDADLDAAVATATQLLRTFPERYDAHRSAGLAAKLGLTALPDDDPSLADDLLSLMDAASADFTNTWRSLADAVRGDESALRGHLGALADDDVDSWLGRFTGAHAASGADGVADRMDRCNPLYIPRNHLVEEALTAGVAGDLVPFERLLDVLSTPFDHRDGADRYAQPAPPGFAAGYRTFCGT